VRARAGGVRAWLVMPCSRSWPMSFGLPPAAMGTIVRALASG
jgi:hypothetical protein